MSPADPTSPKDDESEQPLLIRIEKEEPVEAVLPAPEAPTVVLKPSGEIAKLVEMGVALQVSATQRNIHNVFDDSGYKDLLVLTLFGLTKLRREGDDARDDQGRPGSEANPVNLRSELAVRRQSVNPALEEVSELRLLFGPMNLTKGSR